VRCNKLMFRYSLGATRDHLASRHFRIKYCKCRTF
jgi:hypothetical protein